MRESVLPALRPAQLLATFGAGCALISSGLRASATDDAATVAALDTECQAAVKRNDAGTPSRRKSVAASRSRRSSIPLATSSA